MQVRRTQEINVQNINVELVAQMFKNYRSNVLFHLEGRRWTAIRPDLILISSWQQPTVFKNRAEGFTKHMRLI